MKKIILFVAALLAALPFTLASSIVNAEEVTEEPINEETVIDDSEVELTVSSDTYSSSWNKPGEYHVVYKATDAASNSAFFTIRKTILSFFIDGIFFVLKLAYKTISTIFNKVMRLFKV